MLYFRGGGQLQNEVTVTDGVGAAEGGGGGLNLLSSMTFGFAALRQQLGAKVSTRSLS